LDTSIVNALFQKHHFVKYDVYEKRFDENLNYWRCPIDMGNRVSIQRDIPRELIYFLLQILK